MSLFARKFRSAVGEFFSMFVGTPEGNSVPLQAIALDETTPVDNDHRFPVNARIETEAGAALAYADAGGLPEGATPLHATSGNKANAIATATLPGSANETVWLNKVHITALGATAGSAASLTITGLAAGSPFAIPFSVPAGVSARADQAYPFDQPLKAALGADIVITLSALGAGNICAGVSAWGFRV
ncbi:hypothetical protein [Caulobacter soli]|uniref:hypothetical protein n=1 Tax=Caulobacter soli TaxID=2708539 RepID=UPI0013EDC72A|nr:hypothetical protein [Caulobacter soli]